MFFEHRTFSLARDARHPGENQDAWALDAVRGIAAIADGVSATLFAGRWAQLLVEGAVADPPAVDGGSGFSDWLAERRSVWRSEIDPSTLAWHQKPKLARGAAATLLWLELSPSADHPGQFHLQCYAVGDCCLFHVAGAQVRRAFPIEYSQGYGTDPMHISSVRGSDPAALPLHTLTDCCAPGDLLVLSTDAIAVWALKELESGSRPPWELFWSLTPDDWCAQIECLRADDRLRYDDTTVVLLRIASRTALNSLA